MNKWKGSIIAKIVAWCACISSGVAIIFFGFLAIIGVEENFFNYSYEEAIKQVYQIVNNTSSIQAYRNIDTWYKNTLAEEGFKYGIIKDKKLADLDFHERQSYLETNMTDEELNTLDINELYAYCIIGNEGSIIYNMPYEYIGNYETLSVLDNQSQQEEEMIDWICQYADSVCYDPQNGIFYYYSENYYYPIQSVRLTYDLDQEKITYEYSYDFETGKYYFCNWYSGEEDAVDHPQVMPQEEPVVENSIESESQSEEALQAKIKFILRGDENGVVDFSKLEETPFGYQNWKNIILDGVRIVDGNELLLIDSANIEQQYFITDSEYYLDDNYTLHVAKTIPLEKYWVVSIVPSAHTVVGAKYAEAAWGVDVFYEFKPFILKALVAFIIVALVSFIFLVVAAGHRKNREEIVLTGFDKIALELSTFIIVILEIGILATLFAVCDYAVVRDNILVFLTFITIAGILTSVIVLWYILSICVRIKHGKWWQNSILYHIYRFVCDGVIKIFRNLHILWKLIIWIGVISIIEFFFLIAVTYTTDILVWWFIEKVILSAIILFIAIQMHELQKASKQMANGELSYKVHTEKMFWECKKHGENLNKMQEGMSKAVNERMKSEYLKTELITNVSHDIKTPLTSIINYVDLLGKEELQNEKATEYIEVLERQAMSLKKLIEDLMEASKASTGNLSCTNEEIDVGVFLTQTVGESEEKLQQAGLDLIIGRPKEPVYIYADGRHLWRVVDNLINNICKYSQIGSRVYVNLESTDKEVSILFRNMSKYPLNISGDELMERFVRGDRSRNTEGHGLGLSISKSLVELMGGTMKIIVDGDLFKVELIFDKQSFTQKNPSESLYVK